MMRLIISILLYFVFVSLCANAQNNWNPIKYKFTSKNFEIYALQIGHDGIVYTATNKGLCYFDGKEMISINSNEYVKLYLDSNNQIWACPFNGYITKISTNKNNYKSVHIFENKKVEVFNVCEPTKNNLIFFAYNPKQSIHNEIFIKNDKLTSKIKKEGSNYLAQEYFLENIDENTKKIFRKKIEQLSTNSFRIIDNQYYITNNVVYKKINNQIIEIFDIKKYNLKGTVIDFYITKDSTYYIGLMGENKGAYTIQQNKLKSYYKDDDVTGFRPDQFGNLWMTTLHNGLFCQTTIKRKKESLKIKDVYKIIDFKNQFLCADKAGSLYKFEKSKQELLIKGKNFGRTPILKSNKKFQLYFYNYTNLLFTNSSNLKKTLYFNNEEAKGLYQLSLNDSLIILANKHVINYYLNNCFTQNNKNSIPCNTLNVTQTITDIDLIVKDTLLVSTKDGLFFHSTEKKDSLYQIANSQNRAYYNINNCADGIFLQTDKEYCQFDFKSKKITTLFLFPQNTEPIEIMPLSANRYAYLFDNVIIIFDNHNNIINEWELTLGNNETMQGSLIKNDTFIVYTNQNMYYYSPFIYLNKNNRVPECKTFQITLNSQPFFLEKDTIINYKYHSNHILEIKYVLVNEQQQDNKYISSLILNSNGDTIFNKPLYKNSIQLERLPPENYTLNILFKNNCIKTYHINVLPLWYQYSWLKWLGGFLISSLIFGFIIRFIIQKNKQQKETLHQQLHIQDLEHTASLNQLKPHFIFNALEPIELYALTEQKTKLITYMQSFSPLLRKMLELTTQKEITINEEIQFLNNYLIVESNKHEGYFTFEILNHIEESSNIKIPSLCIQPLVENAIKYGGQTCEGVNKIEIIFSNIEYNLFVQIKDKGKGFDIENCTKNHAVHIIKQRLQNVFTSEKTPFIFTNLKDGFFEVTVKIPINEQF